jgi:hypothetical protein
MPKKKTTKPRVSLSTEQIEIVGQFNDYAHENPKLSFDQVVAKEFHRNFFPRTSRGRKFRSECKAVFDREREP